MQDSSVLISVVSPVYKCSTCLIELYFRLVKTLETISNNFEIIFVNDSSPDDSWSEICKLCQKDNRIKGINLSRNFGQHYAITAGLNFAKGEWIVVMDCDLQDQPEEISKLFFKATEGYDVVYGRRNVRKDNLIKVYLSKLFYRVLSYLTDTKQDSSIANFGIYKKNVIKAILSMGDSMRYFPTMVRWVGFNQTSINIDHAERKDGKTAYSFRKLINLSINVMLAFSDKPLKLTVKLGFIISLMAVIFALIFLIQYILGDIKVIGFTSLIISIWLLSGIIISILGILGLYIGKTFENVKKRPSFVVKEFLNIEENS
jgi:polyisoprenyl-phosphate glycosyltransferase